MEEELGKPSNTQKTLEETVRIYSSLDQAYHEIRRDLFEVGEWIKGYSYQDKVVEGDESFDYMELSPYGYMITDTSDIPTYVEMLELNSKWIEAELYERTHLPGVNPGIGWKYRKEVWEEFLHMGKFAYTYSERLSTNAQLFGVINELKEHPASRQGVITIFDVHKDHHNLGARGRIPCSIFYQPMIRHGKLDLHYVMRSCDFFTHMPYDQVLAIRLQEFIAYTLELPIGNFTHYITSLHAFRRDFPEGVF